MIGTNPLKHWKKFCDQRKIVSLINVWKHFCINENTIWCEWHLKATFQTHHAKPLALYLSISLFTDYLLWKLYLDEKLYFVAVKSTTNNFFCNQTFDVRPEEVNCLNLSKLSIFQPMKRSFKRLQLTISWCPSSQFSSRGRPPARTASGPGGEY